MEVSLKCLLAFLCLGMFCQPSAYTINDEEKVSQKDTAEILREVEEELERRYSTDGAEDNEARNFDVDDEAEMNRETEYHLEGRDSAEVAVDNTPEAFEADDEAELLAMNKAITEGNKEEGGFKGDTSRMIEEEFASQINEARTFDTDDEFLNMNKGEKEERLDKRGYESVHVRMSTPNRYEYEYVPTGGIRLVEDNTLVFGVQACNDAHVRLYSDKSAHSNYYQVILGTAKNTQSRIKINGQDCQEKKRTVLHKPLSCSSKHYFWVTWTKEGEYYNGYKYVLRVGSGLTVGRNKFMDYTGSYEIPVNYVAVSTGFGSTGQWTFYGHAVMISTNGDYSSLKIDGINLAGVTSVTFWVRACKNAYIQLMAHPYDFNKDIYEILIGGWENTRSIIRDRRMSTHHLATVKHKPLSCDHLRPFWMSWDRTILHVGSGLTVGSGKFLSYTDPTPTPIKYLAVATWEASGKWIFDANMISTNNEYNYLAVEGMNLARATSITFQVRAKHDAHVLLMAKQSDYETDIYEIVIGGWDNTKSVIRKLQQGRELAAKIHNPLSGRQFCHFWVSWDKTTVHVGTGSKVGSEEFMSYTENTPSPVAYLAVSTGWGATGEWLFDKE